MAGKNRDMTIDSSPGEALVAGGHALTRIQDETMMTVAVQRKRDIKEVREAVIAEIESFPEFADRYYYSIPHKTNQCQHNTGQACPTCEYVEGPSIHAALALQRYWGNCASSWSPLEETAEHFWCQGTFVDYERNTKFQRPFRADKRMKKRGSSESYPLTGDRLAKAINAAGSKAHRNAILSGIPDPLKLVAFTKAKALTVGEEPDKRLTPKLVEAIAQEFAKWSVSVEVLERKLGKKAATWTMADRARLLGLRNALLDGQASEEVFGSTVQKSKGKPAAPTPIATPPEAEVPDIPDGLDADDTPEPPMFTDEDNAIGAPDLQPTSDPFTSEDF